MRTHRFPSRAKAEEFLKGEGFVFQGAPSRWRKQEGADVLHADVLTINGGAIVVVTTRPFTGGGTNAPEG